MSEPVQPSPVTPVPFQLPRWFLLLRGIVNQPEITLLIYANIAMFSAVGEVFEKEEATELLGKMTVFLCGSFCYVVGATLLGIKMVMSTSWGNGKDKLPPLEAKP